MKDKRGALCRGRELEEDGILLLILEHGKLMMARDVAKVPLVGLLDQCVEWHDGGLSGRRVLGGALVILFARAERH